MEKEKYPIITEFENRETKIDNLIDELSMIRKFLFWFVLVFVAFSCFVSCFIVNCFSKNIVNKAGAYSNNNQIESYNVTDLTNTTWQFNNFINYDGSMGYIDFSINFSSRNLNFESLSINNQGSPIFDVIVNYDSVEVYSHFWGINDYKYISVLGGTDATNQDLISWLQSNATQIQTSVTYNISTSLTNLTSSGSSTIDSDGTATITLTPNTGYILPTTISVTNADYIYNPTTGVITLSNATDDVVITASGLREYMIHITLDAGIDNAIVPGSITDTFIVGIDSVKSYEFTATGSYVFDTIIEYSYTENTYSFNFNDTNLITNFTGTLSNFTLTHNGYEGLTVSFDNVSSDISFSINTTDGFIISNKTFILDLSLYYNSHYTMNSPLIYRAFSSNDTDFVKIIKNDLNNFEYFNINSNDSVNVFTFLTGQYLPFTTYNYQLITFDSYNNLSDTLKTLSVVHDKIRADDNFFNFYRVASQTDLNNITAKNNQLIDLVNNTSFMSLFGAILDAQFGVLHDMLNFNIFEINLWSIVCLFMSITLVFFVIKFIRGGKHGKDD